MDGWLAGWMASERARMLKRMNAHRIKEPLLPLLVLFSSNIAGE